VEGMVDWGGMGWGCVSFFEDFWRVVIENSVIVG